MRKAHGQASDVEKIKELKGFANDSSFWITAPLIEPVRGLIADLALALAFDNGCRPRPTPQKAERHLCRKKSSSPWFLKSPELPLAAHAREGSDSAQPANFSALTVLIRREPLRAFSQMLAWVHVLRLGGIGELPLATAERKAETRRGRAARK
jgi:hypothetical protein